MTPQTFEKRSERLQELAKSIIQKHGDNELPYVTIGLHHIKNIVHNRLDGEELKKTWKSLVETEESFLHLRYHLKKLELLEPANNFSESMTMLDHIKCFLEPLTFNDDD